VAADVKALYPSLCRDTATKVFERASEWYSTFNSKARKNIVELNKIYLNNVVNQYDELQELKTHLDQVDQHR